MKKDQGSNTKKILVYAAGCILVVLTGVVGMIVLSGMKKPPAEANKEERTIPVQTIIAGTGDYPVTITGYGQARSLTEVTISPEVTGRITATHPNLKAGRIILKGELLFRIDSSDYAAREKEGRASVTQWKTTIIRLKKQLANNRERLKTLKRSAELAMAEFGRIRHLFEKDRVGTRSGVDQAERAFNNASDQANVMADAVTLYPLQIREAQSSLTSARARLDISETSLARCEVRALFDARVKSVALEIGQYVTAGISVLTLADDTVLEIQVPLDSRDARKWLQFDPEPQIPQTKPQTIAWFSSLKKVNCTIRWTEDKNGSFWTGKANRVVKFDDRTRTLAVAVRINAADARASKDGGLPLVDGMFCAVDIPGQVMRNVIRLPRQAVTFENKVYLADEKLRLKTMSVDVARREGEFVYVAGGINTGDRVIVTRLVDPLENSLLKIDDPAKVPLS